MRAREAASRAAEEAERAARAQAEAAAKQTEAAKNGAGAPSPKKAEPPSAASGVPMAPETTEIPLDAAPPPAGGAAPRAEVPVEAPAPPPPPPPELGRAAPPPAEDVDAYRAERGSGGGGSEAQPRSYRYEAPPAVEPGGSGAPPEPMNAPPAKPAEPAAAPPEPAPPPASVAPAAAPDPSQNFDVVPIYFGTDRKVEPDPKRLQYSANRAHKLQLGRALITVPQSHKVPHIERPWVIELPYFKYKVYEQAEDPNKHFTVQEITSLSKSELLALVRERLAKSATFKDHAFVFVHGFNTSFDNALYRTAQITYDLKFDGAPFVYSWPSGGKVASYTYDRGSAEQAEPQLAEFLNMVVKESGAKSISLIAHSMGNELLLRVLERMRPSVPRGVVISQVILAAPDVDRDKFANIAREITNFAKGVTLYAASNDHALSYSRRFWGGVPRAGDVPVTGPLIISGVDTIDVTSVSTDGLGLNHSGYAENPELLNDVKALIHGGVRPPDQRLKTILKVDSPEGAFWRFAPAP